MKDAKALPLTNEELSVHTQQDCPDGMLPALLLLIVVTIVIIVLLLNKHPIQS